MSTQHPINLSNININTSSHNQVGLHIGNNVTAQIPMGNSLSLGSNPTAVLAIQNAVPPALHIYADPNNTLSFHNNGEIKWTGSLTKSTKSFIKTFKGIFNKELVGKKFEREILNECLEKAKSLSKQEYIDCLQEMIDNNLSEAVLEELTKDD